MSRLKEMILQYDERLTHATTDHAATLQILLEYRKAIVSLENCCDEIKEELFSIIDNGSRKRLDLLLIAASAHPSPTYVEQGEKGTQGEKGEKRDEKREKRGQASFPARKKTARKGDRHLFLPERKRTARKKGRKGDRHLFLPALPPLVSAKFLPIFLHSLNGLSF